MHDRRLALVVVAALAACKADAAAETHDAPAPTAPVDTGACKGAEREGGALHWFHDDYDGALLCARSKGVPLAIDMWAPWCHTCLSMQAYVLTDERLADWDRRYVFLALDTDRETNAAVVAKFPPTTWPTFFAVSPSDESIQSRFVGAASVEQFAQFLADGERGHQALAGGELAPHEASARDGDRMSATKDFAGAAAAYAAALASAPEEWPRGPDVMVSLLAAQVRAEAWSACAATTTSWLARTGTSASASDFSAYALACADKQEDPAAAKALREAAVARLSALVDDTSAPLSVDDRSDALMYLRQALEALDRKAEARVAAERQRALLDDASANAASPRIAMTYNWPRAEVYVFLGVPLELVPALERSIADLPEEYDPPYRLAWLLLQAGKADEARTQAERAISLAYGPRKARAQGMLADIHRARADVEAERAARAAALATLEALPEAAKNPDAIAKAKADLAAVGTAAPAK
jgi:thioredoxin-like negative regulator of GroEL